jgi:hypothetical protein
LVGAADAGPILLARTEIMHAALALPMKYFVPSARSPVGPALAPPEAKKPTWSSAQRRSTLAGSTTEGVACLAQARPDIDLCNYRGQTEVE